MADDRLRIAALEKTLDDIGEWTESQPAEMNMPEDRWYRRLFYEVRDYARAALDQCQRQPSGVTFHFRINDGDEQTITTSSGVYALAAAAIPAMFDVELPVAIEIWSPKVMPEYGPHRYLAAEDDYGHIVVRHMVPISAPDPTPSIG